MSGISPQLAFKRVLIGIPVILIGLFLLISAIGWLRDWRENPIILMQNTKRAQELRKRIDGIPETMPFVQFRKEFPEAEFNLAHKKHEISVPGNFLRDAPWCSGSFSTYQFEVKEGVVTRGGRRMSIVCVWVPKGPIYYFFRAWQSPEDFDYRKE